jgi:outer membrane protein OmpA-like peptidoglycan-associated protein/tetratricopeptide (TPR) repeat protein
MNNGKRHLWKYMLLVLTILSVQLQAQFLVDNLTVANRYFAKADWYNAAHYYEKMIYADEAKIEFRPYTHAVNPKQQERDYADYQQAVYNCADCYRQLNYPEKAVNLYRMASDYVGNKFPLAKFYHGAMLKLLGRFDEAEQQYAAFLERGGQPDSYRDAAQRELLSLAFIKSQYARWDIPYFRTTPIAFVQSDSGANYGVVPLKGDTVLFSSSRPNPGKLRYANRIYSGLQRMDSLVAVEPLLLQQPDEQHQGTPVLTPDGKALYFTRWWMEGGRKRSSIWRSLKGDKGWGVPEMLNLGDQGGSNYQQPGMMQQGNDLYLLFASDRAGGLGGYDLYGAKLDIIGLPGEVEHLGSAVNSAGNEFAPVFDNGMLLFATDGRVGMGGLDLHYSKGGWGSWQPAVNFGYPVNSIKDDNYGSPAGGNPLKSMWVSSDRSSACCLQLFRVERKVPPREVSGRVVICEEGKPLAGAELVFTDSVSGKEVRKALTGADGSYRFSLEELIPMNATVQLKDHFRVTRTFAVPLTDSVMVIRHPDICLTRIPVEKPIVLNRIYFEYDQVALTPESAPQLDSLATLLVGNPGLKIEVEAHTDSKGSDAYNMKLSQARAQSIVDYLQSRGIAANRLVARGYGETMPLEPNILPDGSDNPDGRAKNRRCGFRVVGSQ